VKSRETHPNENCKLIHAVYERFQNWGLIGADGMETRTDNAG